MIEDDVVESRSGTEAGTTPSARPRVLAESAWPEPARPVVSICCATYNHAPYIRDCLEGFLKQETTFPVEILIHDDASTDGTADIVRGYEARYPGLVKSILQPENQYAKGIRPAFHFLLPRTRGRYVATCDGDDYWTDPTKLAQQVDFLEAHPEYVICYHNSTVVDAEGRTIAESQIAPGERRDFTAQELRKGAWVPTLSRCFRNVVTELPQEFSRVVNADVFLVVLLGEFGGAKYLPGILPAVYRQQPGSVYASLAPHEQALASFNSRLHIYQYLRRAEGQAFALDFMLESVLPFAGRIAPDRNPYCQQLRKREQIIAGLERRLREIHDSPGSRAWRLATWPLRKLAAARNARGA